MATTLPHPGLNHYLSRAFYWFAILTHKFKEQFSLVYFFAPYFALTGFIWASHLGRSLGI